ncbi:site-specific integrase [Boseaceae bacterium BT-24-1]|nr:site-specific integrase [Boseaceae bacterium BT-24-1]
MSDVRRIPGTVLRNGVYYLQLRVPADLVEAFGYSHFKESLRTSDHAVAKREVTRRKLYYDQLVDEKRAPLSTGGVPKEPPRTLTISALLVRIKEYVAKESASRRSALSRRKWALEPGSREKVRAEIVATFEALRDPADDFTRQRITEVAVWLFPENRFDEPQLGLVYDLWSGVHLTTRDRLRRGLLEIERRTLTFLDGDYSGHGLDVLFAAQLPASGNAGMQHGPKPSGAITLADLSALTLSEHGKGSVRQQRKEQLAAAHRIILRYFDPDTDPNKLSPEACAQFRDLLAELPRDTTKRFPQSRSLHSIAEQAKKDGLPTLAKATQETYLGALRGMMDFGVANWKISRNPAVGLKSLARENARTRTDYDHALLKKIFSEPFLTQLDRFAISPNEPAGLSEATRFWVPRIALYTGMRQNEICQLDVVDIRQTASGTLYFFATDEGDDKQLKNAASKKAVPVHQRILNADFMRYLDVVRTSGSTKLFPDATPGKFGHRGQKISKWINRQFRRKEYPRGVDFHAFRHTFRQALRLIDAPTDVAARLGGWSTKQGVMDRYGGALSDPWIDHLNKTLQCVHYGDAEAIIFRAVSAPRYSDGTQPLQSGA